MEIDLKKEINKLASRVDTSAYLLKPLHEWRIELANECQVYVCGQGYLGKRFDEINYQFCSESEAARIVRDNLYALLRFKYFTAASQETDDRIKDIVSSFTANLKTTLKKVSFDVDTDCIPIKMLPDYCCAFRNGVWDFKNNKWFFKYDVINVTDLATKVYMYDSKYAIMWYVNRNFEPLEGINIMNESFDSLIEILKELTKVNRNYCFELMYNISHDFNDVFSKEMFIHLCEVMGFAILQSFSQHFCIIVGSGGNGKNSLFDGCLTSCCVPMPANNDLESIEEDRFITGALENKFLNIFLETSTEDKVYTESKMLKAVTGSMYQTIQNKGVDKRSGILNCKIITAANDQEKVKFADTTPGFRRRINIFEIFYKWDKDGRYLKRGDYYETTFSDSYMEIKRDTLNTIMFVYFAMMGIKNATKDFTSNFEFTYNDWKLKYADVDIDLKDKLELLNVDTILRFMTSTKTTNDMCKTLFYDMEKKRLYDSTSMKELGYNTYDDMKKMLADPEALSNYFSENDAYINVKILKQIVGVIDSGTSFTQSLKKIYNIDRLQMIYNNQPYVKCTFMGKKLKILR